MSSSSSSSSSPSPSVSLSSLLSTVCHRLSPSFQSPPPSVSQCPQWISLFGFLEDTAMRGQNNSILLVGPPGSGRHSVLFGVLRSLRMALLRSSGKSFVLIRLNGKIQTDDTEALREIVTQLHSDYEIELPSPTESFLSLFGRFVKLATDGKSVGIPMIFIIEEFQEFTVRGNNRQTLLYNLADTMHMSNAQMAVIGVTSHPSLLDSLEKRVRSRLTYRKIHFQHNAKYEEILKEIIRRCTIQIDTDTNTDGEEKKKEKYPNGSLVRLHNHFVFSFFSLPPIVSSIQKIHFIGKAFPFVAEVADGFFRNIGENYIHSKDITNYVPLWMSSLSFLLRPPPLSDLSALSSDDFAIIVSADKLEKRGLSAFTLKDLTEEIKHGGIALSDDSNGDGALSERKTFHRKIFTLQRMRILQRTQETQRADTDSHPKLRQFNKVQLKVKSSELFEGIGGAGGRKRHRGENAKGKEGERDRDEEREMPSNPNGTQNVFSLLERESLGNTWSTHIQQWAKKA